jgi:hypothetical protein
MSSVSNIQHQFLETKNHLSGEQISIEDNKFLFYYVPRKLFNYVWVKQRLHGQTVKIKWILHLKVYISNLHIRITYN